MNKAENDTQHGGAPIRRPTVRQSNRRVGVVEQVGARKVYSGLLTLALIQDVGSMAAYGANIFGVAAAAVIAISLAGVLLAGGGTEAETGSKRGGRKQVAFS